MPAIGVGAVLLMTVNTIPDAMTYPRAEIPNRGDDAAVDCHPSGRHLIGPNESAVQIDAVISAPVKTLRLGERDCQSRVRFVVAPTVLKSIMDESRHLGDGSTHGD